MRSQLVSENEDDVEDGDDSVEDVDADDDDDDEQLSKSGYGNELYNNLQLIFSSSRVRCKVAKSTSDKAIIYNIFTIFHTLFKFIQLL